MREEGSVAWNGPASYVDSGAGGDPGDRRSVGSEAFRDLFHGHAGHVGVDELLTLRVAQTSLRSECFRCDRAALIASGGLTTASGGGLGPAPITGDERPERG